MFFLILIANITRAQGYWKLESNEDDYTMEKNLHDCTLCRWQYRCGIFSSEQ